MGNKRDFKKGVQAVGDSVCAEMVDIFDSVENANKEEIAKAVEKVICAVAAAKSNADVTFDKGVKAFSSIQEYGKAKKAFFRQLFKKITDDFYNDLDEALKIFNAAVPEEVKEENKASVK